MTNLDFVLTYLAHRFKYDIPTLKEHAKAYICNNLEHCDILEEIFSSFTYLYVALLVEVLAPVHFVAQLPRDVADSSFDPYYKN